MSDVIKTISEKLLKVKKELEKKQNLLMQAIQRSTNLQEKSNDIEEFIQNGYQGELLIHEQTCQELFGKRVQKGDAVKVLNKCKEELKKAVAEEGQLKVDFSNLTRQKEVAEKTIKTYQNEKKVLKESLENQTIDSKEYDRRKQLIKTSLADIGTVSEKQLSGLKKKQHGKEEELGKLIEEVEKKTVAWNDGNEFVKDFDPKANDFSKKCQQVFGKKSLTKPDAEKAVKKLKEEVDKASKKHEQKSAELAAVGLQIAEIDKRLKEIEEDLKRLKGAYEHGQMSEKEFEKKVAQWKQSVGLG